MEWTMLLSVEERKTMTMAKQKALGIYRIIVGTIIGAIMVGVYVAIPLMLLYQVGQMVFLGYHQ